MEYVTLISKIVAAEQSAKEIVQEAKERERTLETDLDTEVAEMRQRYMERARQRVEKVAVVEKQSAEEDLAHWDQRLAQAMSDVEAAYAKHKNQWVETLFQQVVGGNP